MIGNLLDWWVCAVAVSIFVGVIGADMLARRRGLDPIEDGECSHSSAHPETFEVVLSRTH
jgi:dolichyl-phosphate-mannose--protein O-mannosyl transferase